MSSSLKILGVGVYIPSTRLVADLVTAAGGDPMLYDGWPIVGRAGEHDHPSTMGEAALRDALARCGIAANKLALVLACGVSHDYVPPWSLAA